MTDLGWLGVGAMGAPMAARLATAGRRVRAYDVDPGRVDAVPGLQRVATPAAAAADADVLVVMVATADQGEQALFGPDGAAAALRDAAVVMVMATVGPETVEAWARSLAERGVELIDAPVSGGVRRAADGELLIMVSGAEPARRRVRDLLRALASSAPEVGARPGDAQRFKLVNQLLCGVHIAAAAEALALARALGLDPEACWEVVRQGAAASFMLDDRAPRMLGDQPPPVRSAVDIFVKDLGLVTEAAKSVRLATPVASAAAQLYLQAHRAGLGRADDSSLYGHLLGPDAG